MTSAVRASIADFLTSLDMACSMGGQHDSSSIESAYIARSHAVSVVCNAVMKHGSTRGDVVQACTEIREKHSQLELEKYKSKLQSHIDGTDVLAICAACFHRIDTAEKHDILSKKCDAIRTVCADPMDALTASFKRYGLNMMVLNSILQHSGCSSTKVADLLTQYLDSNGIAHRLHDACVHAAANMREEFDSCFKSGKWSSVTVRVGTFTDMNDCTLTYPTYMPGTLKVSISCTYKSGLCVSSFVDALEQCAKIGAFASSVFPVDILKLLCTQKDTCENRKWTGPSETLIPGALKRDFHVLSVIHDSIPVDGGILRPVDIAEYAMYAKKFFEEQACSKRSLEQVSNHIIRKCAYELKANYGCLCGIQYVKSDDPNNIVGHVKLDAGGSARLLVHIRNLLTCMGSNNRYLNLQWRPSRSSRKMAAKKMRG